MKKTPIEVFSDWVDLGKDHRMETNHLESVENMLRFSTENLQNFNFIDAGCGNGWVVRKLASYPNCNKAIGIDGSEKMISKAKKIDSRQNYICSNLFEWNPKEKVDLVHSMEVFYYFENPGKLIKHIYSSWLKNNSRLIIGLDFYFENTTSHSWPDDCGINIMKLLSSKEWKNLFKLAGFKEVETWRVGAKENWAGTLVVTGIKKN